MSLCTPKEHGAIPFHSVSPKSMSPLQVFHRFLYVALDQSLQLLESETNSTVGEALGVVASQLITTAALDDRCAKDTWLPLTFAFSS